MSVLHVTQIPQLYFVRWHCVHFRIYCILTLSQTMHRNVFLFRFLQNKSLKKGRGARGGPKEKDMKEERSKPNQRRRRKKMKKPQDAEIGLITKKRDKVSRYMTDSYYSSFSSWWSTIIILQTNSESSASAEEVPPAWANQEGAEILQSKLTMRSSSWSKVFTLKVWRSEESRSGRSATLPFGARLKPRY